MSPTLTTFLLEAANFLVLAGVLAWLFFRPIGNALERRRQTLQEQADQANQQLAEAERIHSEMEQQRKQLDSELEQQRRQSQQMAEKQAEQILQQARQTADRELEAAERRHAHLERAQRQHLARVVAETTGAVVDQLLRKLDQPELNRALTQAACQELQSFDGDSLAPVRIESARPLQQTDREILLTALGEAGDGAEFHVIEDLGMGLRIATNRGLVDVSSAGLAAFAEHELADRLAAGTTDADQHEEAAHA